MKIGVLDIQGSVEEHFDALRRLSQSVAGKAHGVEVSLVKSADGLSSLDGLVIPGGESTTLSKLIDRFDLRKGIAGVVERGGVVFGTCAGAILIGKKVFGGVARGKIAPDEKVQPLGLIDIDVTRNAYGTQVDSFETEVEVLFGRGGKVKTDLIAKVPGVFIRAPKISRVGKGIEVLAEYEDEPVLVRQKFGNGGAVVAGTFHPELTCDLRIYEEIFIG